MHKRKIVQYNKALQHFPRLKPTTRGSFSLLDNSWLSGFVFSDGSFYIRIHNRIRANNRITNQIEIVLSLSQIERYLLDRVKDIFGGTLSRCSTTNIYRYATTSFFNTEKIVAYFDRFPLIGMKQLQYAIWRKVFVMMKAKEHLTPEGIAIILEHKKQMSLLCK